MGRGGAGGISRGTTAVAAVVVGFDQQRLCRAPAAEAARVASANQ